MEPCNSNKIKNKIGPKYRTISQKIGINDKPI